MGKRNFKWKVIGKLKNLRTKELESEDIVDILLENRGIKTKTQKDAFFKPVRPEKISVKSLGLSQKQIDIALRRIKKAVKNNEKVLIYGDYDCDGVCATAILWECLYSLTKNVGPYIPNRFDEGYGLNSESVRKLKTENSKLKLIITVDNGIVASNAVETANDLGIDVIITDHHQKGKKLPRASSIIHTDKICGSGVAWILAREIKKVVRSQMLEVGRSDGLELAAIGTIADQMQLLGPNRSFAKYGLEALNQTRRLGLLAMFEESGLKTFQSGKIGTYEVNYVIAPRINAMGRLEHAIDSLRLLCTTSKEHAKKLSDYLGKTNRQRQQIVDEVVNHARKIAQKSKWSGAIILEHENYHEGVIGLAAGKLVEEFFRPAIVVSKGNEFSKASARSVSGFNIIEAIRRVDSLIEDCGGHPMAAGFTIKTDNLKGFKKEFSKISGQLLSDEVLQRKLNIDLEIEFNQINQKLVEELQNFEPIGSGNSRPTFVTKKVVVSNAETVGREAKHLRLQLTKDGLVFNAIAFGRGEHYHSLSKTKPIDIVYSIELNEWNGGKMLQLKIKDMKIRH